MENLQLITLIWQIANMLLLVVVMVVIEWLLCKTKNKWLGLLLPVVFAVCAAVTLGGVGVSVFTHGFEKTLVLPLGMYAILLVLLSAATAWVYRISPKAKR